MDSSSVWMVIVGLGIGTYLSRLSFIALIGDRELPEWLLRLLRYVPVAVMPALVAPLVVWPAAAGGVLDPARMGAALVGLVIGALTGSLLWAIGAGMTTLYALLWLLGGASP